MDKYDIDNDLAGFWLQAGFVEGVVTEKMTFKKLESAYAHIFSNNKENAILLCNGIPVCFSYHEDLPACLPALVGCLDVLQSKEEIFDYELKIDTAKVESNWYFDLKQGMLSVCIEWNRVRGGYQSALNAFSTVTMEKGKFINEWLMLLRQCQQCLADAEAILVGEAKAQFDLLNTVEAKINRFGRFYNHLNHND